jgi:hypothetical protein
LAGNQQSRAKFAAQAFLGKSLITLSRNLGGIKVTLTGFRLALRENESFMSAAVASTI